MMLLVYLLCLNFGWTADTNTLGYPIELKVEGLRSGDGQIAVSVFSEQNAKAFPDKAQEAVDKIVIPLEGRHEILITTKPLPVGHYAVALLHDENADLKLNTTLFGIPREGFGFTNNPTIRFGAPSFEKTQIQHGASITKSEVKMKYMF